MKKLPFLLVVVLGMVLAACGSIQAPVAPNTPTAVEISPTAQLPQQSAAQELTRTDAQGAITVEATPLTLNDPGDTLTFEIGLTTHSVDLSMDLATLATLTTDNGHVVQAALWDAPRGGHHVSGMLSFPASVDGTPVLDGATTLTLTIANLDAPERTFTWELQ